VVPAGSDEVVTPSAGGFVDSDKAAVIEAFAASVSFTVKLAEPTPPGVPEIAPPGLRLKPTGRDPPVIDQE
jgi:hypothetical protein